MTTPRKPRRSPLWAFAPWRLRFLESDGLHRCLRIGPVIGLGVRWFMAGAPTAFCLLLAAFCLLPTTAYCQRPAAVPAPVGEVSKQAGDLILQGFDRLDQHDAAGAEKAFRQAIDVQPEVEAAHRGLGLALREEGQLAEAFRELQTATQLNPSDSDAHCTLGSVAWALSMPANFRSVSSRA